MSEPTNAEIAEQEDMRLDAQIAEWYEEQQAARARIHQVIDEWAAHQDQEAPPVLVEVEE